MCSVLCAASASAQSAPRILDRFDSTPLWSALPSDGVALTVRRDARGVTGSAMALDFDFQGRAGYAIARGAFALGTLGENWSLAFAVKGSMRPNTLEFKLVDSTGSNVWWYTIREFTPTAEWQALVVRQRQVRFAWGPLGGGPPRNIASIEIVVTAGQGGRGTLSIDDLVFTPLPPDIPASGIVSVVANGTAGDTDPRAAIDNTANTVWRGDTRATPTLSLNLGGVRTYGGLRISWDERIPPTVVSVDTSNDGARWHAADSVGVLAGAPSIVPLPDGSSRFIRLRLTAGARNGEIGVRDIAVQPLEFSASPSALLTSLAATRPRGSFPRSLYNEQTYWTIVGVSGGRSETLLSEDGQFEVRKRGPSLMPSVIVEGTTFTWHDARITHALHDDVRPIPSVTWTRDEFQLTVTAFAAGTATNSTTYVRYRVTNRARQFRRMGLMLSAFPLQVNPPWQFLNTPGGAAPITTLTWDRGVLHLDSLTHITPLTTPATVTFSSLIPQPTERSIVTTVPPGLSTSPRITHTDGRGLAAAQLEWPLSLPGGASAEITIAVPLDGRGDPAAVTARESNSAGRARVSRDVTARLNAVASTWSRDQDVASIVLPSAAADVANAVKANLAWILINRDSAGLQPGSRSYERSWIRDGSLTADALLRLGRVQEARQFAEWYAPFQYANGKVPCCVDSRGPDPVDEHDSHGQLIHLIHEVWRYSGDEAFAKRLWPHVALAVQFVDSLRLTHRTPAYDTGALRDYRGLMPASISHEGYSAKPMHSIWDDGFTLVGLREAVVLATALGYTADAQRITRIRDEFAHDFHDAIRRAIVRHGIDYIPGSIELGDFDATSTTTLLAPGGELARLPRAALDATFDRYVRAARGRANPDSVWLNYTPYEWRTIGALLRLDRKADALALLRQLMGDRRPAPWQHWAEVVWRDVRRPEFIGDMPHTWVGGDFIRSALDLFMYERTDDEAMVIAAGIPAEWALDTAGVRVRGMLTPWGPLGYTLRAVPTSGRNTRANAATTTVTFAFDSAKRVPPGGLVVHSPINQPIMSATADGATVPVSENGTIVLRRAVRTLRIVHRAAP